MLSTLQLFSDDYVPISQKVRREEKGGRKEKRKEGRKKKRKKEIETERRKEGKHFCTSLN